MAKKDDLLWKGILEEIFDDFLRFMHPKADEIYDLKKGIAFLDKELEQLFPPEEDEFSPKVVDKLARVNTWEGKEEWILIHVEVQGRYQKDFPRRMFTYYYRILDKYNRRISAYAVFTDGYKMKRPDRYETSYQGTSLTYRFNTYQLALQNEEELLESGNPFAIAVLVGRAAFIGSKYGDSQESEAELMSFKLQLLRKLTERRIKRKKIRALMNFLRYYVRFENDDNNVKFEQEIQTVTGRSEAMGIEELLLDRATRQGEQKKSKEFVENLLLEFGFTDEQAAKAAKVSIEFVQKIRAKLDKKKK
ncbi:MULTISPECIES: RpnC/YadD family protein [Olivibacter]|jgi:hypothetical protein|uniref:Transposase (putative) YhgA-like domain-containing protein n=2 Tax=Olivibacter jilunii TaxID=985016 RepID=A0ABW6B2F0_9SPHI|nr:hypothetical protein [Olivibacter sp. LS-1]MCL4638299.1 hypothetical protein [Olivibacter sp. UJ_SKK_5.1]MDX3915326.1 hypothetical protein [Pseudosphingobacterium sp.]QEL03010.1 hypothetical protein FKG96_20010 [Olivibacter sp. LS-1]